jgi:D-alanyl-D-alanine carboxypeptidase/D-alanyl-D-alanine-endopeptidase (penicillin-binding protein 4)
MATPPSPHASKGTSAYGALHQRLPIAAILGAVALTWATAVAASETLPAPVLAGLQRHGVASDRQAFVATPLDGGQLHLSVGAELALNPASTMKLLTTYAALSLLGPEYRWRTDAYADGAVLDGVLNGNLVLRGGGDPGLVVERWWAMLQALREQGLREIRGDLVIDRTLYADSPASAASFDHEDNKPYNVPPDPLLINFRTVSLDFVPDETRHVAQITATPTLAGMHIPLTVPLASGPCTDWKSALRADWTTPVAPRFLGAYRRHCGPKTWHVAALLSPNEYALASFRSVWTDEGGNLGGRVRDGVVPETATLLNTYWSPPLGDLIRDINKNSNNVMARQVFLTLGRNDDQIPLSPDRSENTLRRWLAQEHLSMPELVIRNGSGLSRDERISAGSLVQLLTHAWHSKEMAVFLASLPIAGVDGTMQHRAIRLRGAAQIKTGTLNGVRSLAGYVMGSSGHQYAVAAILNDPHADESQETLDAFLEWVRDNG